MMLEFREQMLNKVIEYKSATQRKLNMCANAGLIKKL